MLNTLIRSSSLLATVLTINLFSMHTQNKPYALTIHNNYQIYISIKLHNSVMPQYFLPNEKKTVSVTTKDEYLRLLLSCPNLSQQNQSLLIPITTNTINISKDNNNLICATANNKIIYTFALKQ